MTNIVPIHDGPRLLKEGEAARVLSMRVSTLRRWRWAGKGPTFHKLGGSVRYAQGDLDTYLAASRRKSTSDQGTEIVAHESA